MNSFTTRIRQLMFFKGVRQADIVSGTGLSKSKVSRWVSGANMPNGEALIKLADFFGVEPSWLLGEGEEISAKDAMIMGLEKEKEDPAPPTNRAPIMAEIITSEELEMIIRYRLADDRAKALIRAALDLADKYPATTPAKTDSE